eukprot:2011476-Alexandrium_andersonii.AAC.1
MRVLGRQQFTSQAHRFEPASECSSGSARAQATSHITQFAHNREVALLTLTPTPPPRPAGRHHE